MSKTQYTAVDSKGTYDPAKTLPLRLAILKLFKSRRGKWLSDAWIYMHLNGFGNIRSLGSSIRDLRRAKFGGYLVDSRVQREFYEQKEINGGGFWANVLYYRYRGKAKDNQSLIRFKK